MRETILLFQITDKKMKTAITTALLPLKIRVKQISQEDFSKKLGVLAGTLPESVPEETAASEEILPEPLSDSMMILCGIEGKKLNSVLSALRSRHVQIPYKAVLTPSNQEWTPAECLAELKREHEAMSAGASIHQ